MCNCLLCAPYWGLGPKHRNVPWLGTEPVTLWFAGRPSIHWVTPARAQCVLSLSVTVYHSHCLPQAASPQISVGDASQPSRHIVLPLKGTSHTVVITCLSVFPTYWKFCGAKVWNGAGYNVKSMFQNTLSAGKFPDLPFLAWGGMAGRGCPWLPWGAVTRLNFAPPE